MRAIRGLQQKLRQLSCLARASLANQHHSLIPLDEFQELFPALGGPLMLGPTTQALELQKTSRKNF